jgi:hypothetical protein
MDLEYNPMKSDVYSLGLTFLHIARLEPPSKKDSKANLNERLAGMNYSEDMRDLIRGMLAVYPSQRPTLESLLETAERMKACCPVLPRVYGARPLIAIKKNNILSLDCANWHFRQQVLQSTTAVELKSRYIWTDAGLVCCGGTCSAGEGQAYQGRRDAHLLEQIGEKWLLTRLRDMRVPRFSHGLWWDSAQQAVLVFGGKLHTGESKSYR